MASGQEMETLPMWEIHKSFLWRCSKWARHCRADWMPTRQVQEFTGSWWMIDKIIYSKMLKCKCKDSTFREQSVLSKTVNCSPNSDTGCTYIICDKLLMWFPFWEWLYMRAHWICKRFFILPDDNGMGWWNSVI